MEFGGAMQIVRHPPQWLGLDVTSVSQPFAGFASQSLNPAAQAPSAQRPVAHDPLA